MKRNALSIFIFFVNISLTVLPVLFLQQSAFCGEIDIQQYEKNETISFDEFLYLDKSKKDFKNLKLNKNKDVIFKGKVLLKNNGLPLNADTAYTDSELKILFQASGIKPRKNCAVSDTIQNGTLGCYIDIPDKK